MDLIGFLKDLIGFRKDWVGFLKDWMGFLKDLIGFLKDLIGPMDPWGPAHNPILKETYQILSTPEGLGFWFWTYRALPIGPIGPYKGPIRAPLGPYIGPYIGPYFGPYVPFVG